MKKNPFLLTLATVAALIVVTGCQTLSSSRFRSEAVAVKLEGADAYQVSFTISEVAGDQAAVIATPRVVFRAGQPADVRIEKDQRVIKAEAYIQSGQVNPLCLVKTRILENGRQIFHHSEVIEPAR